MTLSSAQSQTRRELRRAMRARRAGLSPHERRQAAERLGRNLHERLWFLRARHLGLYLAGQGELDPLPALLRHGVRGQRLYLPAIGAHGETPMRMLSWVPGEQLLTNRYGIGEPDPRRHHGRPLWALDVLLVPLVAYDRSGNRLGMGGGFYDRLLATLHARARRPRLVGVAYRFQEVENLPVADWDQPLDEIVTD